MKKLESAGRSGVAVRALAGMLALLGPLATAACAPDAARVSGRVDLPEGLDPSAVTVVLLDVAADTLVASTTPGVDGSFQIEGQRGFYWLALQAGLDADGSANDSRDGVSPTDTGVIPLWLDGDAEVSLDISGSGTFADAESGAARFAAAVEWLTEGRVGEAEGAEVLPAGLRRNQPAGLDLLIALANAEAGEPLEESTAARARSRLAPDWPLWSYFEAELPLMRFAFQRNDDSTPTPLPIYQDPERFQTYVDYLEEVARSHPDWTVSAAGLFHAMQASYMADRTMNADGYMVALINGFSGTRWATEARRQPNPVSAVRPGLPVPEFSVRSLEPGVEYTPESFAGKVTLIDFWATWCIPCVAEMENLHDTYEKYAERGFEILSVDVGENPVNVATFQAEDWPMPWHNAWIDWSSQVTEAFEIPGLPRTVLIGRDGIILEARHGIMGEDLPRAVERALANDEN